MLERASSCLESGGRQLLRRTRRCSKSRRMLHSAFWHHAAGDLGLPIWWASAAQSEPTAIAHDRSRERANKDRHGGGNGGQPSIALDFLYPAKTLAFIQHISNLGWDSSQDWRKQHYPASGIRHYSSRSGNVQEFTGLDADATLAEETEELQRLLKNTNALQALEALLQSSNDHLGERVIWRLYELVEEADRTPSLRADLLDYLASSKQHVDTYRLIQVFESLANQDRRASSYRAAITAYLSLNMVGTAVKIHGEAADRVTELNFGSDILLARTIQDNQWDLAFQVRETFASSYERLNYITGEDLEKQYYFLWPRVLAIPELHERAMSLLQYAQQFAHSLAPASERGKSFVLFARGFFPNVIKQVLKSTNPNDKSLLDLFSRLQEVGLSRHEYFELAINAMIHHEKYMTYTNEGKPHLKLYSMFRKAALEKSEEGFLPPSESLIRAMMRHTSKFRSYVDRTGWMVTVDTLVKDFRQFYGIQFPGKHRVLKPPNLGFTMAMYARAGDAEKVHQLFEELCETWGSPNESTGRREHITNGMMWPLLYVHAKRVELHAVVEQFQRMSKEFGLKPDARAWNILLYAYTRADDLDGSLETFEDFLESGNVYDVYSFAPVLDICARRGDVDSIEALFSKARLLHLPIDRLATHRAALVLAHINSENLPAAEDAMESMIQDKENGKLVGQLTIPANYLLTAHAQRQDTNSTMKAYSRYKPNRIPLDSYTYAALMQSLILARQTNAAYKILTTTMPNNNVQGHAFHYALAIAGFLREGQLHRAQDAQRRMLKRNVPPSVSSRMAFLQVNALSELKSYEKEHFMKAKNRLPRLKEVEEEIRKALIESDPSERAIGQPRQGMRQTPLNQMVVDGYFETIVLIYGTHGAYSMCKEMFESADMYRQSNPDAPEAPIGLLTAVMTGHQRAHEHAEVEKCWELARLQAAKLTKLTTGFQDAPVPNASSLRIARNRSHLLVRTTRVYFRDLAARKAAHVNIGKMRILVSTLLNEGYIIDNLTWNEYIQYLARSGYFLDAFTACESYLMPDFAGWRSAAPNYLRDDPHGYLRMDLRKRDTRKHTIMPRYKTLVIMAAALGYIRRQEEMGVEPEPVQKCSIHRLRQVAPTTMWAIETMPVLPDEELQKRYLMSSRTL